MTAPLFSRASAGSREGRRAWCWGPDTRYRSSWACQRGVGLSAAISRADMGGDGGGDGGGGGGSGEGGGGGAGEGGGAGAGEGGGDSCAGCRRSTRWRLSAPMAVCDPATAAASPGRR